METTNNLEAVDLPAAIAECATYLRRYALTLTRNPADADDLVQDTIERGISKAGQYELGTNLRRWIATIMRSLFINGVRKARHKRAYRETYKTTTAPWHNATQYDELEFGDFTRAFSRLSPDHRWTIQLFAFDQRSHREAAEIMGIEVATAKTRLFRARAHLSSMMDGTR